MIYSTGVDDYMLNEIKKAKYQGCFDPGSIGNKNMFNDSYNYKINTTETTSNTNDLKKPFYNDSMPSYPFPSKNEDVLSEITGSWLEEIKFDDKVYFSIKDSVSPQIYPSDKCLDSDARYREDKQWLKLSWDNKEFCKAFEGYAQCWKLALEAQQRFDRGLRKEYNDKRKAQK